jgi:hypothetical protein
MWTGLILQEVHKTNVEEKKVGLGWHVNGKQGQPGIRSGRSGDKYVSICGIDGVGFCDYMIILTLAYGIQT